MNETEDKIRLTKTIATEHYLYNLIECQDRNGKFPQGNFRDNKNYVLKSITKI